MPRKTSSDHVTAPPPEHAEAPLPRAAERIRASAAELFYREGIRAVGVDEIVSRAGVTKPSLYRSFASKDELAAAYLRDYEAAFWNRFEEPAQSHPQDPRGQLLEYMRGLSQRATRNGYRGCGLTNAAVEYPAAEHPARLVAQAHKRLLRRRLTAMCKAMGARTPDVLADGLLLLLEGAYASGLTFGANGPARALVIVAEQLIDAHVPG